MHFIRNGLWAPERLTRRQFAAAGIAMLAAGSGMATQKRERTAESGMGPFYPVERLAENDADLTHLAGHSERASGTIIQISGRVLDLKGNPVSNASLELWQANAAGRYLHPNDPATAPVDPHFQGFAALRTDAKANGGSSRSSPPAMTRRSAIAHRTSISTSGAIATAPSRSSISRRMQS